MSTPLTITIQIAGVTYDIVDNSIFDFNPQVEQRTKLIFTVEDLNNVFSFQKGQQVTLIDSINSIKFTGTINTALRYRIGAGTTVFHDIDCNDMHQVADERTTNKVYNNQYTGLIVAGMTNDVLSGDGITANYAIREDNSASDFSQGTLSGLVATNNLGGDLELAPAGSDVIIVENTTAQFATGTLNNTTASNNSVTPTATGAIKMQCTQSVPGNVNSYVYVRFFAPSLTISGSGNFLVYDIFVDPSSPECKFGVDIWFTDGTQLSNSFVYADIQNLSPAPTTDLSAHANGQWYHREFYLLNFSGKSVSSINFACGGQKLGTYTAYIKNINYLDNSRGFLQTFFNGTSFSLNPPRVTIISGYQIPYFYIVNVYDAWLYSVNRYSPSYSIDAAKILKGSFISWESIVPSGNIMNMYYSIDGGASYQQCTNNAPLPNLPSGMSLVGKSIIFVAIFNQTTTANPEQFPELTSFECILYTSYAATKTDVLYATTSSWSTGATFSNTVANGTILNLIGALRNWSDASIANQTAYGTSSPGQSVINGFFVLSTGLASTDAKSEFNFAGTYADQIIDVDMWVQSAFQTCVVYRTTYWGNAADTYAYMVGVTTTAVQLGRGTNNSTGGFTLISSATISVTAGQFHHLQVVVSGSNHQIFFDGVLLLNSTDATFSAAGNVGFRIYNASGSPQGAYYANFGVMKALTGTWISPNTSIASATTYGTSVIFWGDASTGTSVLLVEVSYNAGSTYATCTNGQPLPGLTYGQSLSGVSMQFRITLTTGIANVMPGINDFNVYVIGQFSSSGTRIAPVLSLSSAVQCGNATASWEVNIPTNTSFALATSLDNITYNGIFGLTGIQLVGLTTQPPVILDTFAANDSSSYTHLQRTGGSAGTWTWDTTNSRVTVSSGTNDMQLYSAVWFNTGYQVKKQIVIDHTKVVGGADLTNYPLLVSLIDPNLVIPSGYVQNVHGYDIIFVNATETTQLNHEIEYYNDVTGEIEMHVMIPTLSHTADTVIWMYFCNSGISTSQEHVTATWDSNFKAVWHMDAATGSNQPDSTSNAITATQHNSPAQSPGQSDGSLEFNGTSQYLSAAHGTAADITGDKTIEMIVNVDSFALDASGAGPRLLMNNIDGTNAYQFSLITGGIFNFAVNDSAGQHSVAGQTYSTDTWYYLAGTYVSSTHTVTFYINGVVVNTGSNALSLGTSSLFNIGRRTDGAGYFNGGIDETRISNIARTAGWIGTVNNNLMSPGTFFSVGELTFQTVVSSKDIDVIVDMDYADCAGVIWRQTDAGDFYELDIFDGSSNAGSTNVLKLYKVVSNVKTQIGATITITFPRGTPYRARVTMQGTAITVWFDGVSVLTATDSSLAGPGKAGLIEVSGTAHFYNLRIQPLGQSLSGVNLYSKVTLTSTDPTATPQLTDLVLAVLHPNIALGPIISTVDYRRTFFSANMDDLAKKANWTWQIDPNKEMIAGPAIALPTSWILTDKDVLYPDDGSTSLSVENSGDLYRNRQILTGVLATMAISETHPGDGKSTSWTLKFPVVADVPTIFLNGQAVSIGQKGIDTGMDFYFAYGSTSLAADPSLAILQDLDSFEIFYTGQFTTEVERNNTGQFLGTTSQSQYAALTGGAGIVEVVEDVSAQQIDIASANAYGDELLQKYGVIGRTLTCKTNRTGLQVGQYITVFIPEHNLNDVSMLITSMDLQMASVAVSGQLSLLYYWELTCVEGPNLGSWQKTLVQTLGYNPNSRSY